MPVPTEPSLLPLMALAFGLAGFVKGLLGLGLPTVAMAILALAMPPAEAAALVFVPSLVTNIGQIGGIRSVRPLAARLWPLLVTAGAVTWLGAEAMLVGGGHATAAALGWLLVAYAALGLTRVPPSVSPRLERWLSPVIGALTGTATAATGIFVLPVVPYLQALGMKKDELIRAMGLSFTCSTIALALALMQSGLLDLASASDSLLALVPALAGMGLGQILRGRLDGGSFRRVLLVGLLVLGLWMAIAPGR